VVGLKRRAVRRTSIALALACGLATSVARGQPQGPPYPRLANMYLQGAIDRADIPALARWDVLILDPSWSSGNLQLLRILNPNIKLFYYVCAYCTDAAPPPANTWRRVNYDYAAANDLWWWNWNQTVASDWPGARLLNITALGPVGPQGAWRQFMAARVEQLVRDNPEIDGVFYDNFWQTIGWEQGGVIQVDSDCNPTHNPAGCNGFMDTDAQVDTLWNRALRTLAQDTRNRFDAVVAERGGRPLAVITNSSTDYFTWLNGTLHEYFPTTLTDPDPGNAYGYDWNQQMLAVPGGYLVAPFRSTPYQVSVLNADWSGTWTAPDRSLEFERHKRFTLVSSLLGDGYYSLDAAETGHGSIWWEPEFDHAGRGKGYLGYPLGPMRRVGVPGGPERVTNGSFTGAETPWSSLAYLVSGSWRIDTADYHTAPGAARIDITSLSTGGSFKLYQAVPVQGGHGYTLSFWARTSSPQELLLHLYSPSCPGIRCLSDQRVTLGTAWTRYEISFVATGTASAGLNLFTQAIGTVWIDDVSLREGDTSVYRRDFDNGTVILNYTTTTQTVDLAGTFHHLSVPGSALYDGAVVTSETVPPSDARILLSGSHPTAAPPPAPVAQFLDNQPNPFNPTTRIRYAVDRDELVQLCVYDLAGRLLRTLVNEPVRGGVEHNVAWDGRDGRGVRLPSGVYMCRITTPSFSAAHKMILLK
jgi:hypothetical protein